MRLAQASLSVHGRGDVSEQLLCLVSMLELGRELLDVGTSCMHRELAVESL